MMLSMDMNAIITACLPAEGLFKRAVAAKSHPNSIGVQEVSMKSQAAANGTVPRSRSGMCLSCSW